MWYFSTNCNMTYSRLYESVILQISFIIINKFFIIDRLMKYLRFNLNLSDLKAYNILQICTVNVKFYSTNNLYNSCCLLSFCCIVICGKSFLFLTHLADWVLLFEILYKILMYLMHYCSYFWKLFMLNFLRIVIVICAFTITTALK